MASSRQPRYIAALAPKAESPEKGPIARLEQEADSGDKDQRDSGAQDGCHTNPSAPRPGFVIKNRLQTLSGAGRSGEQENLGERSGTAERGPFVGSGGGHAVLVGAMAHRLETRT
jgi:hypothetical protein